MAKTEGADFTDLIDEILKIACKRYQIEGFIQTEYTALSYIEN